jgi:hypothetical protein
MQQPSQAADAEDITNPENSPEFQHLGTTARNVNHIHDEVRLAECLLLFISEPFVLLSANKVTIEMYLLFCMGVKLGPSA